MNQFNNALHRLDANKDLAYSLIRIFLGVALFVRGVLLFADPSAIVELARAEKVFWWYSYITIAHLFGGFFMAIGLMTRFAALLQLPILMGAVFVIHIREGLLSNNQSLELAALVFFLLLIYSIYGSGPLSLDKYFAKKRALANTPG